jgi:hypothetical protein
MASTLDKAGRSNSTAGITAVGVVLFFGAVMAAYAGMTLIWRGTVLDELWALNMPAYERLAPFGAIAGPVFLLLSAALACTGAGWFKRRLWGWRLATIVILVQVLGDLINLLRGDFIRGGIGLAIAGLLLFYLLRPKVRVLFEQSGASGTRCRSLLVPLCLGGQAALTAMDLELSFIRAHVAASNLRPAVKILAGPAHPPGEMNRFRSCSGEMEGLPAFALRAVGPVNRVDNRVGSVNSNHAVKVDGGRASSTVIARCCVQGHLRDVAVLRGVAGSRQKEKQARTQHQQRQRNPSSTR